MPYIAVVPPSKADAETAEVYAYMHQVGGADVVAKIVQMFSIKPTSMRRMIRTWELAMWMDDEPRAARELVAASVSRMAECHY